jgi:hypothetical protein
LKQGVVPLDLKKEDSFTNKEKNGGNYDEVPVEVSPRPRPEHSHTSLKPLGEIFS